MVSVFVKLAMYWNIIKIPSIAHHHYEQLIVVVTLLSSHIPLKNCIYGKVYQDYAYKTDENNSKPVCSCMLLLKRTKKSFHLKLSAV